MKNPCIKKIGMPRLPCSYLTDTKKLFRIKNHDNVNVEILNLPTMLRVKTIDLMEKL